MALAANLAGLAFTSGGLGGVHGLAYVLGTEYHMSHGRSNAIMLPHVMDYNKIGNLEKYAQIARAMGEHIQGLCAYEAADKSIDAVKKLLEAVDISIRLPDYGIRKEDLPRLVQGGMKQARLFVPNPRDLTKEDVEKIYKMALI
jgi:alcohol dehydrogenase class IV